VIEMLPVMGASKALKIGIVPVGAGANRGRANGPARTTETGLPPNIQSEARINPNPKATVVNRRWTFISFTSHYYV
jgi:hypothetical protein